MRSRIRHETLGAIFDLVYLALMTNLLLVLGCLPLVVAAADHRPGPLLAAAGAGRAAVRARGLRGASRCCPAYTRRAVDRGAAHLRAGLAGRRAGRAIALGALTSGCSWCSAWTSAPRGAARSAPWPSRCWSSLIVLVVATALLALVLLAERPAARLRDAAARLPVPGGAALVPHRRCRWSCSRCSQTLLASRPAIALGLAAAPLLYVVWANSRFTPRAARSSPPADPPRPRPTRENNIR